MRQVGFTSETLERSTTSDIIFGHLPASL